MVEFMTGYRPPMEREDISLETQPDIEAPIIPLGEIGTTAVDTGPGGGTILSNLDKSIRVGTKKIQLVISGGQQGGGVSSLSSTHGKDVRREVREKAKVSGVEITGVELSPGRVSGLAGFNQQSGTINDEQRSNDLRQVKYAIKFAADVAGGGGVDIWSQEFNRNIFDADWNKEKNGKKMFFDNQQSELDDISKAQLTKYLIDRRNGNVVRDSVVRTTDTLYLVQYEKAKDRGLAGKKDKKTGRVLREDDYIDIEGNYVDRFDPVSMEKLVPKFDKEKQFEMKRMKWDDIVKATEEYNKHYREGREELKPEEWAYKIKLLTNMANMRGHAALYHHDIDLMFDRLREKAKEKEFAKDVEEKMSPEETAAWKRERIKQFEARGGLPDSEKERLMGMKPHELVDEEMKRLQIQIQGYQELVTTYTQQSKELREVWDNVETVEKYAKERTFDGYAEAGVYAWQTTKEQKLEKPIYVGPEIGWAGQGYGGHPDEFIQIVKESRKKMAEKLKAQGLSEDYAAEVAKKHIKGMMDTSHLTMWYKHFAKNKGETEEAHLKRFNDWTKDQVKKMVKEGVVGGVQVVDSITGEHSHLPAGQGIFDVVNMVKAMKEAGFTGPIVSEGHEEEQYNQGRILTETWRAFGAPIGKYSPVFGQPGGMHVFGGVQHGYMGYRMPHTYIVGAYSPSNDWQLWSETPFE